MSSILNNNADSNSASNDPDEYNLYLGFMVPIGAILALCIICLMVISWQLIAPECSKQHCPKIIMNSRLRAELEEEQNSANTTTESTRRARGTSIAVLRRYSDFPPSYETLLEHPPPYDSVVIIEEECRSGERRNSGIRTYVYDPMRRVSIEVHDEDTIRVVESLLSRRRSSSWSSHRPQDPPGYSHVIRLPNKYPEIDGTSSQVTTEV